MKGKPPIAPVPSMFEPGEPDAVEHPAHYTYGPVEVIDLIEGFELGFHLGNVVKYVLRAPHKGAAVEDLRKARWYLDRYIDLLQRPPGIVFRDEAAP